MSFLFLKWPRSQKRVVKQSTAMKERFLSRWLLSISEDGEFKMALVNLCRRLVTLTVKKHLLIFQRQRPVFQFEPSTSGSVAGHHWPEPGFILCAPSLQVFIYIDEIPPEPSLLKAEHSHLPQPFPVGEMLQFPRHLSGPLLDSAVALYLCYTGEPTTGCSTLLMQPRTPLTFFAARSCCWLKFSLDLESPGLSGPFLQSCFPAGQHPAYTGARGCSSPGTGLCISFVLLDQVLTSEFCPASAQMCTLLNTENT